MKRSISIVGSILLAAALTSPAWAHPGKGNGGGSGGGSGGGESQAGGLPGLEDRVEADEALIATLQTQVATLMSEVTALQTVVSTLQGDVATLQGQNNFAVVTETSTTCTLAHSSSVPGPVTATLVSDGQCAIDFGKNVSGCAFEATINSIAPAQITAISDPADATGDTVLVETFNPAAPGTLANNFSLTVTCP